MKKITKLLSVLIGIIILMSSCTEWLTGEEDDNTPPSEVANLRAEELNQSIKLTWTDPENSDLENIYITYTYGLTYDFIINPGIEEILFEELGNGVEYTFLIQTHDDVGNRSEGVEIKATPSNEVSK